MVHKRRARSPVPTTGGVISSGSRRSRHSAAIPFVVPIIRLLVLLLASTSTTSFRTTLALVNVLSGPFGRATTGKETCSLFLKPVSMQRERLRLQRGSTFQLRDKNWDKILAEEEQDENEKSSSPSWKNNIPFDMKYNQRNCQRSQQTFQAIRSSSSSAPAADLYGCDRSTYSSAGTSDPINNNNNNTTEALFWFLGKVAHVSDVSLEQCVARQWSLIQLHAANLRPLDLFPAYTNDCLELWCAPADTEFDVAYNRPAIVFQRMRPDVPGAEQVKSNLVGFQGEVYEGGEEGFRTWRNVRDGSPARPEITGSPMTEDSETPEPEGNILDRPPTDEEMQRLEEMLKGQDINELYEEQERRSKLQKGQ